jgi:hypothetical protein
VIERVTAIASALNVAFSPAGLGAAASVSAMALPEMGLVCGAATTGTSSVSVASSGTQTSLHTSQSAAAFRVTVWPGLASAGTVMGTGR